MELETVAGEIGGGGFSATNGDWTTMRMRSDRLNAGEY